MAALLPSPSPQQKDIYGFIEHGNGNCVVSAVAGSGKTTTIIGALKFIPSGKSAAVIAFNKPVADELKARIEMVRPSCRAFAGTFHSFGSGAVRRAYPSSKLEKDKFDDFIADEIVNPRDPSQKGVPKLVRNFVRKAYNLCRMKGFGLDGGTKFGDSDAWVELIADYQLENEFYDNKADKGKDADFDANIQELAQIGCNWTVYCIRYGQKIMNEVYDFEDMIYAPVYNKLQMYGNDFVFVDEMQDINASRRLLAKMLLKPNGRFIGVGDPCQPNGTKVYVVRKKGNGGPQGHPSYAEQIEQVNIEDVVVGDKVVSYSLSDTAFIKGREIIGVTHRNFDGNLVRVTMEDGRSSEYTPNHHCIANFNSLREHYCVYLMRKGDRFRVGQSRFGFGVKNASNGAGPFKRLMAEKADDVWILAAYKGRKEAIIAEEQISTNFGLSQAMFTAKNNSAMTNDDLDTLWTGINDHYERAVCCLQHFGRDINYPIVSRNIGKLFSLKRPGVFRACNLLNGVLMLPYNVGSGVHSKKADWRPVTLSHRPYSGNVVSFTVEKDAIYCGDGIMTHNCQAIYHFSGADANSYNITMNMFECVEMPLSVSWRCSEAVVKFAQGFNHLIEASPKALQGSVTTIDEQAFEKISLNPHSSAVPGDAILCRVNAPLVSLFFQFLRRNIPAKIQGRDLADKLQKLLIRFKSTDTLSELVEKITEWSQKEIKKAMAKQKVERANEISDQAETLIAVIGNVSAGSSVEDVKSYIKTMFEDVEGNKRPTVVLSSIHRSKGLEFKRVFWLGRNLFNPSYYAVQSGNADQLAQEDNLQYVAATRAMEDLIIVNMTPKKKK